MKIFTLHDRHLTYMAVFKNFPNKLKDLFVTPKLALNNNAPKVDDDITYTPVFEEMGSVYSYNFDAIKFAEVINEKNKSFIYIFYFKIKRRTISLFIIKLCMIPNM